MTRTLITFLLLLTNILISNASNNQFRGWKENKTCVNWVDSVYNTLSWEERIGQFFMLAAYTAGEKQNMDTVYKLITEGKAGGVIFFKGLPEPQVEWTNKIQQASKLKAFVAIDGEWGLNMRLDSTVQFPRQLTLGALRDNQLIYDMGREIGRECKRMGIHINFAPDVDINNNPDNPVINERSFSEDKFKVALKGLAYADGLQDEGVLACAKHFPGHGDTDKDSHRELPSVVKGIARIQDMELYPFRILFNNGVGSAMVAHLNVPALDTTKNSIGSLSKRITTDWLQDSLGFDGLVFSDALNMKAVSVQYPPGTVDSLAFMAGNDILVFSEDCRKGIEKLKMALDSGSITEQAMEARVKKVLAYKFLCRVQDWKPINTSTLLDDLNNNYARLLRQKLFESAITLVANKDNLMPIQDWPFPRTASVSIASRGMSEFQRNLSTVLEADMFNQMYDVDRKAFEKLLDTLSQYPVVIIDLHGMSRYAAKEYGVPEATRNFINDLAAKTKVILHVFGSPYSLKYFKNIRNIVLSYEDNGNTQLAALNVMFGTLPSLGRMPVTACNEFPLNTGLETILLDKLKLSSPEETGLNPLDLREIDDVALKGILGKAFPGCQVIVSKDNKVIYSKGYGNHIYGEQQKVETDDIYDLASITKVAATNLAVMKLVELGELDINNTVGDYLPLVNEATIKQLKLADVLTHQAGLKPFIPFYKNVSGNLFETYFKLQPSDSFRVLVADSLYLRNDYPDTMWNLMATSKLESPGHYVYSDIDFYILQKVVEEVTGEPLDEFVSKYFYRPMGLQRIGYKPLERFAKSRLMPTENDKVFRKRQVWGHVHDPGAAMYGQVAGHAGLFSNAFDLAAVFQMLLNKGVYNGRRFLDTATVNKFTSHIPKLLVVV